MSGDLICVPVANPPAFWAVSRCSPIDGRIWRACFRAAATARSPRRSPMRSIGRFWREADFLLDIHSAGVRFLMPTMVGYDASDARGEAAARIFGAPVIWAHDVVAPGRSVSAASARGIPWLYTEARGAGRIHPADLEVYRRGILNLLRHLVILPGDIESRRLSISCMAMAMWTHRSRPSEVAFWFLKSICLKRSYAGQRLGVVGLVGSPQEHFTSATRWSRRSDPCLPGREQ